MLGCRCKRMHGGRKARPIYSRMCFGRRRSAGGGAGAGGCQGGAVARWIFHRYAWTHTANIRLVPVLACNYYEGCILHNSVSVGKPNLPPRHSTADKVSYPPSFFAAITTPLVNFISPSSQSSTQPSFATAPHWPQPGSGNARTATNLFTLPWCIT